MGVSLFLSLWAGCTPQPTDPAPGDPPEAQAEQPVAAKVLHRLNRAEYDNTVRDLLGTTLKPSTMLPPDEITHSFDNIAEALTVSATHLGAYEAAADRMLDEMMGRFEEHTIEYPPVFADDPGITYFGDGVLQGRTYTIREGELTGTATVSFDGTFEISASAYGQQQGPRAPELGLLIDGVLVHTFEITATEGAPEQVVHEVVLDPGLHRVTWRLENPAEQGSGERRSVSLQAYQVVGPLDPVHGTTDAYDRFVTCDLEGAQAESCAEEVLPAFLYEAWRRPPTEADVDWALSAFRFALGQGESADGALQHAMKGILLHPRFSYRIEQDPEPGEVSRRLDGFELASRLSYFFWSTMPDARLFDAAERGDLDTPEGITASAYWMLDDPRSSALVDNLAGQWWNIRVLGEVMPLPEIYPEFDEPLRRSMQDQIRFLAEDFFAGRQDLRGMLLSQEAWLDARLAEHLGVEWSGDPGWSLVPVPDGRTGLIGTAGWLTTNSNPESPNAVRRGKWVLSSLLCDSPPPPPPEVEAMGGIEPEPEGGSVRQQAEALRAADSCQSCHRAMDPIGFSLGDFDGVGAVRTVDELGYPIDTVVELEGTTLSSMSELASWIADDPRLPRCVVEKTFTYAMGRPPTPEDEPDIEIIVERFVEGGSTFPALADAIVASRPFQHRSAPSAEESR